MVFIRASLSKQRVSVFATTRIRSRVMITDQDMFAHMTNSRYFSFSDLGVINYIVRTGAWPKLRKKGWFPVVCAESVVFTKMLRSPQGFEVQTRLAGWDDTYICLRHDFIRDEQTTATVRIVARFASRKRQKVVMSDVTSLLDIDAASPPLGRDFLDMIENIEAARSVREPV